MENYKDYLYLLKSKNVDDNNLAYSIIYENFNVSNFNNYELRKFSEYIFQWGNSPSNSKIYKKLYYKIYGHIRKRNIQKYLKPYLYLGYLKIGSKRLFWSDIRMYRGGFEGFEFQSSLRSALITYE